MFCLFKLNSNCYLVEKNIFGFMDFYCCWKVAKFKQIISISSIYYHNYSYNWVSFQESLTIMWLSLNSVILPSSIHIQVIARCSEMLLTSENSRWSHLSHWMSPVLQSQASLCLNICSLQLHSPHAKRALVPLTMLSSLQFYCLLLYVSLCLLFLILTPGLPHPETTAHLVFSCKYFNLSIISLVFVRLSLASNGSVHPNPLS